MSTFFGGPQIASITGTTSSYTVPSGFWARVHYVAKCTNPGGSTFSVGGASIPLEQTNPPVTGTSTLPQGSSISFNLGTVGYAGIELYKNP